MLSSVRRCGGAAMRLHGVAVREVAVLDHLVDELSMW